MEMDTKNKGDLVINGIGSSNGGQFHRVTLNGRGTVNNDVECSIFDCNGSGVIKGNVKSERAKVNGNARFNGNIESLSLTIDGRAKIDQNLDVKDLKISGKATVGGRVKSEEIKLRGILTVGEDCEAEIFKADYRFNIGGLLNADQINVTIYGDCKAKEIGGQTIIVKQHKGSLLGTLFKPFFNTQLETELMEGDQIDIENTKAMIVRGNNVKIGANCNIGLVEYTDELLIDPKAIVGESRKI
jgi:cytoskeletal protein CcmA (bactofilin family)